MAPFSWFVAVEGEDMLTVLLVGYGLIGPVWARVIEANQSVDLVGVVDSSKQALLRARSELVSADVVLSESLEATILRCRPMVIVDATPPSCHLRVARAALAARCHLLAEKPLGTSMEEALSVVNEWRSTGLVYMVSQNYRWNPVLRELRDWLSRGTIGEIIGVYVDFFRKFPEGTFRDSLAHSMLLDMAVHHFDLARFITAREAVWVQCWERSGLVANAVFGLTDGAVLDYRGSWANIGHDTGVYGRWRIVGDRGSVLWSGESPPVLESFSGPRGRIARTVVGAGVPTFGEVEVIEEGLAASLDRFLVCVSTRDVPETSCFDNLHTLAMVAGAIRSVETADKVWIEDLWCLREAERPSGG
jgi:predicted dehydrogenase